MYIATHTLVLGKSLPLNEELISFIFAEFQILSPNSFWEDRRKVYVEDLGPITIWESTTRKVQFPGPIILVNLVYETLFCGTLRYGNGKPLQM